MDNKTLEYMGRKVDIGRKLSGQITDVKIALDFLKSEKCEESSGFNRTCDINFSIGSKHFSIEGLLGIERSSIAVLILLKPFLIQLLEDRLACLEKEYAEL